MAHKGRLEKYSKKRAARRTAPQINQNETSERFEIISGWERNEPEQRLHAAKNQSDDDHPHQAFSEDREAPSWVSPGANINIGTKSKAEDPSKSEQHTREKFVRALHSAWASATSKANSDATAHRVFNADHPQSLEERLKSLGETDHTPARNKAMDKLEQDAVAYQSEARPQTDGNHIENQKPVNVRGSAFNEEGLQGIVDKLRPDVIGIHPDDRMMPTPRQRRTIQWNRPTIAITALVGISLGAVLLYQNVWLANDTDSAAWQVPPAFTAQKAAKAPVVAATKLTPAAIAPEQPAGLNHTPLPRKPDRVVIAKPKIQERLISTPPAEPGKTEAVAPLPEAPPLKPEPAAIAQPLKPVKITRAEVAPVKVMRAKVAPVNNAGKKELSNVTIVTSKPHVTALTKAAPVKQEVLPPPAAIDQNMPPLPLKPAAPTVLPAPPEMVITPAAELPKNKKSQHVKEKTTLPATQRIARLDTERLTTPPKPATATPPLAIAQTAQRSLSENSKIIAQADVHMASGDISSARLLYSHAAHAGDVEAAVKLAQTYDPISIEKIKVYGVQPNLKLAQKWYQFASERGNSLAAQRLQALNVWLARIDQFKN